jgi:hypothetical protein
MYIRAGALIFGYTYVTDITLIQIIERADSGAAGVARWPNTEATHNERI